MSEMQASTGESGPRAKVYEARAFAASGASSGLAPTTIRRRGLLPRDVQIEILFCGVCHSDLHQVRNEWQKYMPTVYPCVPGHEIVGRVTHAGTAVRKFKEGDLVAVGCLVDDALLGTDGVFQAVDEALVAMQDLDRRALGELRGPALAVIGPVGHQTFGLLARGQGAGFGVAPLHQGGVALFLLALQQGLQQVQSVHGSASFWGPALSLPG